MNFKIQFGSLSLLTILNFSLLGQSLNQLNEYQELYWNYKDRFHEFFVIVDWGGDGKGQWNTKNENKFDKAGYSIPVGSYVSHSNCKGPGTYWEYGSFSDFDGECHPQPENIRGNGAGVIKYGDGTYH